ncbi:MAG: PilZ domain-containing protein [Proteobacteria bacterium]|nr:PilZ domain-containing protein [Pseudomonadota bacterium]
MALAERRNHPRHMPPRETVAAVRPDYGLLGRIRNISFQGLLFQYLPAAGEDSASWIGAEVEVDIFLPGESFYLLKVPCRIIHDEEVCGVGSQVEKPTMRRCGLKFEGLSEENMEMLGKLLARSSLPEQPLDS